MTFICGTGDEKTISEMSDKELIAERDLWNSKLQSQFYTSSNTYNIGATIVREIELELNRREHEGPPWIVD